MQSQFLPLEDWSDPDRREESLTRCLISVHLQPWPWEIELTEKERVTLLAFAGGLNSEEAAVVLGVSLETIKSRRRRIGGKLRAKTTAQAVAVALRHGIIT